MSDGNASRTAKTREQIEIELMEALQQRRLELSVASDENRYAARQLLLDSLTKFNGFILYGKLPDES